MPLVLPLVLSGVSVDAFAVAKSLGGKKLCLSAPG
jgi:hypothetical protein